MINDIKFSQSFIFCKYKKQKYGYSDMRSGAKYHYFAYMLQGKCKIVAETYEVNINTGELFYIPLGCKYQSFWEDKDEVKFISLGFKYMPNFDGKTYMAQALPYDETSVKLIKGINVNTKLSPYDIGLFYTMAARLIPVMLEAEQKKSNKTVDLAKYIISENPRLATAAIAKKCNVCESALYAAFSKSSEMSLHTYRLNALLEKAEELLITTDMPIEEISEKLVFSSSSYFRKKFKEYFNLTPREIRDNHII